MWRVVGWPGIFSTGWYLYQYVRILDPTVILLVRYRQLLQCTMFFRPSYSLPLFRDLEWFPFRLLPKTHFICHRTLGDIRGFGSCYVSCIVSEFLTLFTSDKPCLQSNVVYIWSLFVLTVPVLMLPRSVRESHVLNFCVSRYSWLGCERPGSSLSKDLKNTEYVEWTESDRNHECS